MCWQKLTAKLKNMKLRADQKLVDGEVVIYTAIKLDDDANVVNSDELRKCPFCKIGLGKTYYTKFEENGDSELRFCCERCSERWAFRYKNPLLFIKI